MRVAARWACGLFVRVPVLLTVWPLARIGELAVRLEDWLMDAIPGPTRR